MGAGNVKSSRTEPAPLRISSDMSSHKALQYRASSGTTGTAAANADSHISPLAAGGVSGSGPPPKRWDVTCNVHRSLICRFCGGKSCKREDWKTQKDTPAIRGLHSTWVSANVMGMQRLSTRLIREFAIVEQFKKAGIGAVINLQLAGEHPHWYEQRTKRIWIGAWAVRCRLVLSPRRRVIVIFPLLIFCVCFVFIFSLLFVVPCVPFLFLFVFTAAATASTLLASRTARRI
jgi:hypothetical protein